MTSVLLDAALLTRLLHPALGAYSAVRDYHVVRQDEDYAVVVASPGHPLADVVVKLAGPRAPLACPYERTAAINRLVRAQTQVPTYEVLDVDVSYQTWPWRYLVTTHLPGMTWAAAWPGRSAGPTRDVYNELGRVVAALHGVCFPACGEIGADGSVEQGSPYLAALQERARRRIANPRHAELFVSLLLERADLFEGITGAALCHEDLNPHNILVAEDAGGWRIAGILDFDSAWAGSGESDLARLELWRGMTGEGFWQGYEAIRPLAPGYAERRAIHQLLWCLEYARPTRQHLADTARVCAALVLAPVSFP